MHCFLTLLVLATLACVTSSIKCYQCRTDNDTTCESDAISDNHLKECPPTPRHIVSHDEPFCRSINQILYFTPDKRKAVIRECGYEVYETVKLGCYTTRWVMDNHQEVCDCTTEACNASHSLAGLRLLVVLLGLLALGT